MLFFDDCIRNHQTVDSCVRTAGVLMLVYETIEISMVALDSYSSNSIVL